MTHDTEHGDGKTAHDGTDGQRERLPFPDIGEEATIELPSDTEIVLRRSFDASRSLVFKAWTKSEHLDRWACPDGITIRTNSFDFRVGGSWDYVMLGPDEMKWPNFVRYLEIDEPSRIVYDHGETPDEPPLFRTTIDLVDRGDDTTGVTFCMTFPDKTARDGVLEHGAGEGAQQTLAKLDRFVTRLESGVVENGEA